MRRLPIRLSKLLGNTTADYRWFAVAYLILLYFVVPLVVFGLSLAGWYVLLAVLGPVVVLLVVVVVVNVLQSRRPRWLPATLRSWDWLPLALHSLRPYDGVITACCRCCRRDADDASKVRCSPSEIVVVGADASGKSKATSSAEQVM